MALGADPDTARDDLLPPGTKVEVRDAFNGGWSPGFTIEAASVSGYLLRRRSDGELLPAEIIHDHVRRERKSMWWV